MFANSVGWCMASVQLINANMTLFLHVFDKLLDSDVKNGMLFIFRTGQRTEVLLCWLTLSLKPVQLNLHFHSQFGLGGGMEGEIFQIFWQFSLVKVVFFFKRGGEINQVFALDRICQPKSMIQKILPFHFFQDTEALHFFSHISTLATQIQYFAFKNLNFKLKS